METIKLLELFSGLQAQERSLRQIGIPYESVGVCDCDKDVLVSAAAMRFNLEEEIANYEFPSAEAMIAELQNKNIGYSFEKEKHTITSRTPINKLKQYYISDKILNNLGDISKVERLPYADLVTYSSPCQSFSVAGKLGGAAKTCKVCGHKWDIDFSNPDYNYKCPVCGNVSLESTTSGLLFEVQRLLSTAYEYNELPKYLLLENVKNLVGKKFVHQFNAWVKWLDSIGYNTYYEVLNAKHYGIPQNR
jgi:DNA (cytosine-5)-methyltransferase 1